jgi:hypothetical protein
MQNHPDLENEDKHTFSAPQQLPEHVLDKTGKGKTEYLTIQGQFTRL